MPPSGGFSPTAGKFPQTWDCVVVEAVACEPVSAAKVPFTGIFQRKKSLFRRLTLFIHVESTTYGEISHNWNRDICRQNRDF
jgi:hypothetical protein